MTKPPSPLRTELLALKLRYLEADNELAKQAQAFWKNGGVCCPSCGVTGYSELENKQERRLKRIKELEVKLALSETASDISNNKSRLDDVLCYFEERRSQLEVKRQNMSHGYSGLINNQIRRIESKTRKAAIRLDPSFVQTQDELQQEADVPELPLIWETQ